jgi:hypothetical protein
MRELNRARAHERRLPSFLLPAIWNRTDVDSPLRRYVVDTWHNGSISSPDKYPPELLFEIVSTINTRQQIPKVVLSPKELEKYYVKEVYCDSILDASEDDSSLDYDVAKASKPAVDSLKRKRAEAEGERAQATYEIFRVRIC